LSGVSESFWKKEISLKRKPKATVQDAEPQVVERTASEPFWKKEISFKRKPKATVQEAEPQVVERTVDAVTAPPPPRGDYGWLTSDFDPEAIPDAMPAIAAPPVDVPAVEVPAAEPERPAAEIAEPKQPEQPKQKKQKEPKKPKEPKAKKEKKEKKESALRREVKMPKLELRRRPKQVSDTELQDAAPKRQKKQPRQKAQKPPKGPKGGAVVGLKIGASQVAAARVSNGASPQLLQFAREPLADGVVVGGELRDVEALTQALKDLFAKNKLPKRGVRLGIANNRIGVRTFEIAGIDDPRQLSNAIRFRAQETLPIPLEEAVLDWQVLAEWRDEETGELTRRVLLVVAYRELVDRYVSACRRAGIKLSGIDLEAFAMLRALTPPPAPDAPEATGAQVVVNVGHDRSTFAVSNGRVCEFTRVLGWGGQSLSVAIARVLDATPAEVTPIKHALSLVAQGALPEGVTAERMSLARDAVLKELQSFARELVSSLRFYQNQPGSLGIGAVVLTGGTAYLPGFADELQRLIGVPVRVGDPLNRLVLPKKFHEPEDFALGSLTVAIGLGIED
jgi:type IV pilus assembly protein PilM